MHSADDLRMCLGDLDMLAGMLMDLIGFMEGMALGRRMSEECQPEKCSKESSFKSNEREGGRGAC